MLFVTLAFTALSFAQLVPATSPIPRKTLPPVVFMNGYQNICGGGFSNTFGIADQVLQGNGEVSIFFDNCNYPNSPAIEDLGASFGTFLAGLKYTDGQPVTEVDVVAHSMGGLILRSYLSGKKKAGGFAPPARVAVRKVIFLATPHFGTGVAMGFGFNDQLTEIASGSRFLFDLATWNQTTDDLRGVDALALIGNGGTGRATMAGFDDGVVALTSASLRFVASDRTRVLPYCHVSGGGLVGFAGLCSSSAQGIADISSATQDTARAIISFLNGTSDWRNIGTAPEQDRFLASNAGLYVAVHSPDDQEVAINKLTATGSGASKDLNIPSLQIAYTDIFPAGAATLTATTPRGMFARDVTLPAGGTSALVVKTGPLIARAFPAASVVSPLTLAPGEFVSIYGSALAPQPAQASLPFPNQLGGAQVSFGGTPALLQYAGPLQINAVVPENATGYIPLKVTTPAGSHTVNVLVEAAVPALFTQDQSGSGAASILNGRDQSTVTANNPVSAGDIIEIFLTGLGATTARGDLQIAKQLPKVSIAGKDCAVAYAGRAPGYPGLDQINCTVPTGVAVGAATITVTSGNRTSNAATLAIR